MTKAIEILFFNLTPEFIQELRDLLKNYDTTFYEQKAQVRNADYSLIDILETWDLQISYL